jgi:putative toxin-antitoxin system antitoxin component (TIGR02293 family)
MAAMVQEIAGWLGTEPKTEYDLAQSVRNGLALETQTIFLAHGLTRDEFHRIVIPQRTFRHRTERRNKGLQEVLSPEESDKAVRAARILAFAERVFAGRDKALSWMRQPKKRFHGDTPMTMLETETGARLVEQMLVQIDDGMFA